MAVLSDAGLLLYLTSVALGGVGTLIVAFRRDAPAGSAPLTLAVALAALTCFGGGGILALRLFAFSEGRGLVAALLFALLGATIFGGLAVGVRRDATRNTQLDDLIGALATVTIAIEPGRHGAVAPRFTAPPLTLLATSARNQTIPVGTTVMVTAVWGMPGQEAAEVAPLPAPGAKQAAD